jgi:hypothetical protein
MTASAVLSQSIGVAIAEQPIIRTEGPPARFGGAKVVGCFLFVALPGGRYEVWNSVIRATFWTYSSSWDELEREYLRQSESWMKKAENKKVQGSAWRKNNFGPPKQAAE